MPYGKWWYYGPNSANNFGIIHCNSYLLHMSNHLKTFWLNIDQFIWFKILSFGKWDQVHQGILGCSGESCCLNARAASEVSGQGWKRRGHVTFPLPRRHLQLLHVKDGLVNTCTHGTYSSSTSESHSVHQQKVDLNRANVRGHVWQSNSTHEWNIQAPHNI